MHLSLKRIAKLINTINIVGKKKYVRKKIISTRYKVKYCFFIKSDVDGILPIHDKHMYSTNALTGFRFISI